MCTKSAPHLSHSVIVLNFCFCKVAMCCVAVKQGGGAESRMQKMMGGYVYVQHSYHSLWFGLTHSSDSSYTGALNIWVLKAWKTWKKKLSLCVLNVMFFFFQYNKWHMNRPKGLDTSAYLSLFCLYSMSFYNVIMSSWYSHSYLLLTFTAPLFCFVQLVVYMGTVVFLGSVNSIFLYIR